MWVVSPRLSQPPKIKYQTTLELANISFAKLSDEAMWAGLWHVASKADTRPATQRRFTTPQQLYQWLLPFIAGEELSRARHHAADFRAAIGAPEPEFRTLRRSKALAYGCVRHALRHVLHTRGIPHSECRQASLLLRMSMLELASHDAGFVPRVSPSERCVLDLARRRLAYKATKVLPHTDMQWNALPAMTAAEEARMRAAAEEMAYVRALVVNFRLKLDAIPGADVAAHAPPLLALCPQQLILCRPSVTELLARGVIGVVGSSGAGGAFLYRPPVDPISRPPFGQSPGGRLSGALTMPARLAGPSTPFSALAAAGFEAQGVISDGPLTGGLVTTTPLPPKPPAEQVDIAAALAGVEVIGLFFSTGWCPSCVGVEASVISAYRTLRLRDEQPFEIVWVSQDASADEYERGRTRLPFPALPKGSLAAAALADRFHVQQIPALVLLRADGGLISTDGLRLLRQHPQAYPWSQRTPPHHIHLHPHFDRLLRKAVHEGKRTTIIKPLPIDLLAPQTRVSDFAGALSAVRHVDRLSTLIAVQGLDVKSPCHLIVGLIEHAFTQLIPLPLPNGHARVGTCIYRAPIKYSQQLDMLELLQRMSEHFAAAAFSLEHTRSIDSTRMVVPWAIAAIADAVMRQRATDFASQACTHLNRYTIGAAALAQQAAETPCYTPELNVARTKVLDYFAGQSALKSIMVWETGNKLDQGTSSYIELICRDHAFPRDDSDLRSMLTVQNALLCKNFPEFSRFRDIVFWAKLACCPEMSGLPAKKAKPYTQRDAELKWKIKEEHVHGTNPPLVRMVPLIVGFGRSELIASRTLMAPGQRARPTGRFVSQGHASCYTGTERVETEDDVLHLWDLPGFGLSVGAPVLSQQDSELLLSYLTVPYLRIPLVLSFFATNDRAHALTSPQLQQMLDAVMFEPGKHLHLKSVGQSCPIDVPASDKDVLGSAHHLLINELRRSPKTSLDAALSLGRAAVSLDVGGGGKSTSAAVTLYVVRLLARFDSYITLVLNAADNSHAPLEAQSTRDLELDDPTRQILVDARAELRALLWRRLSAVLTRWLKHLVDESNTTTSDSLVDENTRRMSTIHAHLMLSLRNCTVDDLTDERAARVVNAMAFLNQRHQWGAAASSGGLEIPEHELWGCLQALRRPLVAHVRNSGSQKRLDAICDGAVSVSAASGGASKSGAERAYKWSPLGGKGHASRFAALSTRAAGALDEEAADSAPVLIDAKECERAITTRKGAIILDLGLMQITLDESHPQALPKEVMTPDVKAVLGDAAMQCCLVNKTTLCSKYRLIGSAHVLQHWDNPASEPFPQPLLTQYREYAVTELFSSEKAWLPSILEPFRLSHFSGSASRKIEFFLPDDPLPEDAQSMTIEVSEDASRVSHEIVVYRARRMIHVYKLEQCGRRWYRTLAFATDANFCLAAFQPDISNRTEEWTPSERHAAGDCRDTKPIRGATTLIERNWQVPENLSLGNEAFVPARLLNGLLPAALLESHVFWQDESEHLRGYAKNAADPTIYHVQLHTSTLNGDSTAGPQAAWRRASVDGTTHAIVLRLSLARCQAHRQAVLGALEAFESFLNDNSGLMVGTFEPNRHAIQAVDTFATAMYAGCSPPAPDAIKARTAGLLGEVNTAPLFRKRESHRTAPLLVVELVERLLTRVEDVMETEIDDASAEAAVGPVCSVDVEKCDLILLNLLDAPPESQIYSLATLMARIEPLSFVLCFARYNPAVDLTRPGACTEDDLWIVALPRLKLTFELRRDADGGVRLRALDHADLFVSNERPAALDDLLRGIPHALVLSNSLSELSILVPAALPVRPTVSQAPFTTELVLNRYTAGRSFLNDLAVPYHVYPVHVSGSYLTPTTHAAAFMLVLLRFQNRQYADVCAMVDSIGSDEKLSDENKKLLDLIGGSDDKSGDSTVDATACRLKVAIALLNSPSSFPFDLTDEMCAYVRRLSCCSAACRLTPQEELIILTDERCLTDIHHPKWRDDVPGRPRDCVLLLANRLTVLRAETDPSVASLPRDAASTHVLGAVLEPTVEADDRWISTFHSNVLGSDIEGQIKAAVAQVKAAHYAGPSWVHNFDAVSNLFKEFNSTKESMRSGYKLADGGGFLLLWNLFVGKSRFEPLTDGAAATGSVACVSCATLLLGLTHEAEKSTLLTSLLTLLARKPALAAYMPGYQSSDAGRKGGSSSRSDEKAVSELLQRAVSDVLALGLDEELTAKVVQRRVELMSSRTTVTVPTSAFDILSKGRRSRAPARAPAPVPAKQHDVDEVELLCELKTLGGLGPGGWRALATALKVPPVAPPTRQPYVLARRKVEGDRAPLVYDYACAERVLRAPASLDIRQVETLATMPLQDWSHHVMEAPASAGVRDTLGFDVSSHPVAASKISKDLLSRLTTDVALHAQHANAATTRWLALMPHADLHDPAVRGSMAIKLREVCSSFVQQRDADKSAVQELLAKTVALADAIGTEDADVDASERQARARFELGQLAGMRAPHTPAFLLASIISSTASDDLAAINPFAPHELVLDQIVAVQLISTRIGALNRCISSASHLLDALVDEAGGEAPSSVDGMATELISSMMATRHYFAPASGTGDDMHDGLVFDPRFLAFEFAAGMLLRKPQVELVQLMVANAQSGHPLVKQMLMGGGKTTVICPLLSLILGDGQHLVVVSMPLALLEQSKATLRAAFSSIIKKRITTLVVERSTQLDWGTVDKLQAAQKARGVLLCTAQSLKSLLLKLLEHMSLLGNDETRAQQQPATEHQVRAAVSAVRIFQRGTLIMDEVDLLLHPLKSELNFPIGEKHPLPVSPDRWTLAMHAIDAIFVAASGKLPPNLRQSARAHELVFQLKSVISSGYERRALQRSPHLCLLDLQWYRDEMRPIVARWMLLYLEQSHIGALSSAQMLAYMQDDAALLGDVKFTQEVEQAGAAKEKAYKKQGIPGPGLALNRLHAHMEATLDEKSFVLLNLSRDWLCTYLPHCLQKIDRVAFGLLTTDEFEALKRDEPHMPRSRLKLAIPFVGKDVPSRASEFAHPDVLIGHTVLAYRYEGLREVDVRDDVIKNVRADFEKEAGSFRLRRSAQLFASWVHEAGGVIKGEVGADAADEECVIVPLWLLERSNVEQLQRITKLLRRHPRTIDYYLSNLVFPEYMKQQTQKLSASGQELGGAAFFGQRLGFSGTPSDLLPLDLGRCEYERGSEGHMLNVLTDPRIVSVQHAPSEWSVDAILDLIANAEPAFNALIDVGALITGISNQQVAESLLARGLPWCDGVVFLNERDEKMIFVRATGRAVPFEKSGIAVSRRFAFYDQVHTTGMDIGHVVNARGVITLGKDSTFRDYAQGAFRMRGIAKGQTLTQLLIPELFELVTRELSKLSEVQSAISAGDAQLLQDVAAWLIINSMKTETTQFNQLCMQNTATIYRTNAFNALLKNHRMFTLGSRCEWVNQMLGETFVAARGSVTAEQCELHKKPVALIFGASTKRWEQTLSKGTFNHVALVWIPSESTNQHSFNQKITLLGSWLGIPPNHVGQIKMLRDAFGIGSEVSELVLLDVDRVTISRSASPLIELVADSLAANAKEVEAHDKKFAKERSRLEREKTIAAAMRAITPQREAVKHSADRLGALAVDEMSAIASFAEDAPGHAEALELLQLASTRLETARRAIERLPTSDIDQLAIVRDPSPTLRSAVCAVAICLGGSGDFAQAQLRVVRGAATFKRRVTSRDAMALPKNATSALHGYITSQPPDSSEIVAAALHEWVLALLGAHSASTHVETVRAAAEPNAYQQAAVEVIAELCDLVTKDFKRPVDLKTALRFAAAFPIDKEVMEEAVTEDVLALESKDEELGDAIEDLKEKQSRANKEANDVYLEVGTARTSMSSQLSGETLKNINRMDPLDGKVFQLMLAVVMPKYFKQGQGDPAAAMRLAAWNYPEAASQLLNVSNHLQAKTHAEATNAPVSAEAQDLASKYGWDVSSWDRISAVHERLPNGKFWEKERPAFSGCVAWLRAMTKYARHVTMCTRIAEELKEAEAQSKACKERLNGLTATLGGADGVTNSQIASIIRRVDGSTLTREQTIWAIKATSRESDAIALLESLKGARKAASMLRSPEMARSEFNLDKLDVASVRRVRTALSNGGVVTLLAAVKEEDVAREAKRQRAEAKERAAQAAAAAAAAAAAPAAGAVPVAVAVPLAGAGQPAAAQAAAANGAAGSKKRTHAEIEKDMRDEETRVQAHADRHAPGITNAELFILRWASTVADYSEARRAQQIHYLEDDDWTKQFDKDEARLLATAKTMRTKVADALKGMCLEPSLVPPGAPWAQFPWALALRPSAEVEEHLRNAIGNRDLDTLTRHLSVGATLGLNKKRSKVVQQASALAASLKHDAVDGGESPGDTGDGNAAEVPVEAQSALKAFLEPVDLSISTTPPQQVRFVDTLVRMGENWAEWISPGADSERRDLILSYAKEQRAVSVASIETEQCREQEQEKEAEQEQEQQIELERYSLANYVRDGEEPQRWPVQSLGDSTALFRSKAVYPAKQFALHGRPPLPFPDNLVMTRNTFNPEWIGERRLKNAVIVAEWVPSIAALGEVWQAAAGAAPPAKRSARQQSRREQSGISGDQMQTLRKTLALFEQSDTHAFGIDELQAVLTASGDEVSGAAELLASEASNGASTVSHEQVASLLISGRHRRAQTGRKFVLLSLAEAETLRCLMHHRRGQPLIEGCDVALRLRYLTSDFAIIDTTENMPEAPSAYPALQARTCFKFLDSNMHFSPTETNILLRSIPALPCARRLFFSAVTSCRRRAAKEWSETPLRLVFMLEDEWSTLRLRGIENRLRASIVARGLLAHDAYTKFSVGANGAISLGELYGAILWLELGYLIGKEDVVFVVRALSQEPHLLYATFVNLLCPPEEEEADEPMPLAPPLAQDVDHGVPYAPKGGDSLLAMLRKELHAAQVADGALEKQYATQHEAAQRLVTRRSNSQKVDWLLAVRTAPNAPNPYTQHQSIHYDFTRGELGTQNGMPTGVEAFGKYITVTTGKAQVPCVKMMGGSVAIGTDDDEFQVDAYFRLRVPMRTPGANPALTSYTVTVVTKMPLTLNRYRKLQPDQTHRSCPCDLTPLPRSTLEQCSLIPASTTLDTPKCRTRSFIRGAMASAVRHSSSRSAHCYTRLII